MKYLLTVELSPLELFEIEQHTRHNKFWGPKINMACRKVLEAGNYHGCPNCGKRWTDYEGNSLPFQWMCQDCRDSQSELRAISAAYERDREATTGENAPAEELE